MMCWTKNALLFDAPWGKSPIASQLRGYNLPPMAGLV